MGRPHPRGCARRARRLPRPGRPLDGASMGGLAGCLLVSHCFCQRDKVVLILSEHVRVPEHVPALIVACSVLKKLLSARASRTLVDSAPGASVKNPPISPAEAP